jgi:peptidoglycan/xylan/chitin deacetylase (PgdA/CDA1 family)
MYFVRIPNIIKKLYPKIIWEKPDADNCVYLTFDDGPHPEITPRVLEELDKYNVKASFFCLGNNAQKYPDIVESIRQKGHTVGNHSFSHLDGWKTKDAEYLNDIGKADTFLHSKLFRPPYGKIKRSQYSILNTQYSIFNWSLMPGDFDTTISSEKCFQNLAGKIQPGDIICLHDNEKAWKHLQYCLPRWLRFLADKKMVCKSVTGN